MDFAFSARCEELREQLLGFMDAHVYPAEEVYRQQMADAGDPNFHPPIVEDLKKAARAEGLWNLFLPHAEWGAGLSNLDYAPLAEITIPVVSPPMAKMRLLSLPLISTLMY